MLDIISNNGKSHFETILTDVSAIPGIKELRYHSKRVVIVTDPIVTTVEDKNYFLGVYEIELPFELVETKIRNLYDFKVIHPHSLSSRELCLGGYNVILQQAVSCFDLYIFVLTIMEFLRSVSALDRNAKSNLAYFPQNSPDPEDTSEPSTPSKWVDLFGDD